MLGDRVRYDGTHRRHQRLIARLDFAPDAELEWLKVCPEVELGLGVPRERIGWVQGPEGLRLVIEGGGRDITDEMAAFSRARLEGLAEISGYVFKSKSPSCGLAAAGLFAVALRARFPGLPVVEDSELGDDAAVALFAKRVRDYASLA